MRFAKFAFARNFVANKPSQPGALEVEESS